MNYIKHIDREKDRASDKVEVEPLTRKSDRPRATYGSLIVSTQTVRGLCVKTSKCVRKNAHKGDCWPR